MAVGGEGGEDEGRVEVQGLFFFFGGGGGGVPQVLITGNFMAF